MSEEESRDSRKLQKAKERRQRRKEWLSNQEISHSEQTKLCPYCAEDIKAAAIVCKHCGRELNGFQDTISKTQDSQARELVRKAEPLEISIRRIFDYSGRANRGEFALYYFGPIIAIVILAVIFPNIQIKNSTWRFLIPLFSIIYVVPVLSVSIRRFHDLGLSGWAVLLLFLPLINFIAFLFLLFSPGKEQGVKDYSSMNRVIGLLTIVISLALFFVYVLRTDSEILTGAFWKSIISESITPTPKRLVTRTPMKFLTPTPDMPLWAPSGAINYPDARNYIGEQVVVCGQILDIWGFEDEPKFQYVSLIFGDLSPSNIMARITKRNFGFSKEIWKSFWYKHVCVFGIPQYKKVEGIGITTGGSKNRIIIPVDNPLNLLFDQN